MYTHALFRATYLTKKLTAYFLFFTLATFVLSCAGPSPEPPPGTPKLVVLLVVDQLRADLLERYDVVFDGGFRRLLDEGLVFTEAHHGHAGTTTSPGHATISTGCDPAQHSVITNYFYGRESTEVEYSVGDPRYEVSPRRLECSALGDWLKKRYSKSRVFAISAKDRSAVLLGGKMADAAYWYDAELGSFVSSNYYRHNEVGWLEEWNLERPFDEFLGQVWEPRVVDPERTNALGVIDFDLGPLEEDFPHAMGAATFSPDETYYSDLRYSPWMDEKVAELAQRLVRNEQLGADQYPDVLAIGFSTLDAVGHEYGADSREVFEVLVGLDRQLVKLFDFLDETVGLENVGIALSSDHGSMPVPEVQASRGLPGKRADSQDVVCFQGLSADLRKAFGDRPWLRPGPFFDLDENAFPAATREALGARTRQYLEACPSVERVWLATELEGGPVGDEMQRRFARSYHPQNSPDFLIQWQEYFLSYRMVPASHGSPYRYDTHVPLIFWKGGLSAGKVTRPAETIDIAPTLANWLSVEPASSARGRVLDANPASATASP